MQKRLYFHVCHVRHAIGNHAASQSYDTNDMHTRRYPHTKPHYHNGTYIEPQTSHSTHFFRRAVTEHASTILVVFDGWLRHSYDRSNERVFGLVVATDRSTDCRYGSPAPKPRYKNRTAEPSRATPLRTTSRYDLRNTGLFTRVSACVQGAKMQGAKMKYRRTTTNTTNSDVSTESRRR